MSVLSTLNQRWKNFARGFSPIVEEPDLNAEAPQNLQTVYFMLQPNGLYLAPQQQPIESEEVEFRLSTLQRENSVLKFYMSQVPILDAPIDSPFDPVRNRLCRLTIPYAYINPKTFFDRYLHWARAAKNGLGYFIGESKTLWVLDELVPEGGLIFSKSFYAALGTAKPELRG